MCRAGTRLSNDVHGRGDAGQELLRSYHGYALLSVVVVVAVLLVAGSAAIRMTRFELLATSRHVAYQKAFYIADSGVERALAQLHADRFSASDSTSYSYSTSESMAGGSYQVSIVQDPSFPTNPRRKQIQSTGTWAHDQAVVVANAFVQPNPVNATPTPASTPPPPAPSPTPTSPPISSNCPCLLASYNGAARLVSNVTTSAVVGTPATLFDGEIFSNNDISFNLLAGINVDAVGEVRARRDFISNSLLALLTELNADAHWGNAWVLQGLDVHVAGNPTVGIHFRNGALEHGVQSSTAARDLFRPHYADVKRDPRTVIVNADNVPCGTWNAATGTWICSDRLVFPETPSVIYYVDGNADLGVLSLSGSTNALIVTRGWLAITSVNLVTAAVSAGAGVTIATGPTGSAASVTAMVSAGSTQTLHLVAEEDLSVGRSLLSRSPLTFDSETNALLDATTGIALDVVGVAVNNRIFAYSETGPTWLKLSTLDALGDHRVNVVAWEDATLAFNGSILSSTRCYDVRAF